MMWSEILKKIEDFLAGLFGKLKDQLEPFCTQFASEYGEVLLDVAAEVVSDLAKGNLSSAEKRDAAFTQITGELKTKGIEIGASIVNSAIEVAVAKLKATK